MLGDSVDEREVSAGLVAAPAQPSRGGPARRVGHRERLRLARKNNYAKLGEKQGEMDTNHFSQPPGRRLRRFSKAAINFWVSLTPDR